MHTKAVEDYLKAIFEVEREQGKVSTTVLAERMGVAPASVTGMLKKLDGLHLVTYERYQGVLLTESGRQLALEVIRHHRLVELYLAQAMDVPWDRVHDEAEKWEHVLSEYLEDRIDTLLGHPVSDPHGAPIPGRDGAMPAMSDLKLSDLEPGQTARVAEVSDHDADLLRYLGQMGLYPGTELAVVARAPFNGPVTLQVQGAQHVLGLDAASQIFVNRLPAE